MPPPETRFSWVLPTTIITACVALLVLWGFAQADFIRAERELDKCCQHRGQ